MADEPSKPADPRAAETPGATDAASVADDAAASDRSDRGISDFVRRAVSAGVGAAARSKDDIMRVAAQEMRAWLEHMNMNDEVAKLLSTMVIEVKTEIRFRPNEAGKMAPQATNDVKLRGTDS